MLRVKVEVWPGGDESQSFVIGTLTAANVGGEEKDQFGHYECFMTWDGGRERRDCTVGGHRRMTPEGLPTNPWNLILAALEGMLWE
jgi:hypothetical protein